MQLGKRNYSDADMIRMQREAEERVREMHSRARDAAPPEQEVPAASSGRRQGRGWASNPNYNRSRSGQRHRPPEPEPSRPPPPPEPEPEPAAETAPPPTTIIGDIMAALNMDEDYLLIIGLLLILINQRADTTLILALAYLLI